MKEGFTDSNDWVYSTTKMIGWTSSDAIMFNDNLLLNEHWGNRKNVISYTKTRHGRSFVHQDYSTITSEVGTKVPDYATNASSCCAGAQSQP